MEISKCTGQSPCPGCTPGVWRGVSELPHGLDGVGTPVPQGTTRQQPGVLPGKTPTPLSLGWESACHTLAPGRAGSWAGLCGVRRPGSGWFPRGRSDCVLGSGVPFLRPARFLLSDGGACARILFSVPGSWKTLVREAGSKKLVHGGLCQLRHGHDNFGHFFPLDAKNTGVRVGHRL